jgi:hypothetical protein
MCVVWISVATAASRDVQIVEVDFSTQVIELFNFGPATEDLHGWRFCSHDSTSVRRYSTLTALSGVSIGPSQSLFVHLLSDAGGQPGHIDRPAGGWADPMDPSAHGLQIYFAPAVFSDGNTIADHVQWSIDGVDDLTADDRSDEAEVGGVWTDQSSWVVTRSDSTSIRLNESADGLILHGPSDYTQVPEPGGTLAMWIALCTVGLVRTARRQDDQPASLQRMSAYSGR